MSFLPLLSSIPSYPGTPPIAPISGPSMPAIPGMNPRGMTGIQGLLENPLFGASMGLLSANTPSPNPVNYAGGLMGGLAMSQNAQAARQGAEMQRARYQAEMERLAQQQEEWAAQQAQTRAQQEATAQLKTILTDPAATPEQKTAAMIDAGYGDSVVSQLMKPAEGPQSSVGKLAADLQAADPTLTPQAALALAEQKTADMKRAGASSVNVNTGGAFKVPSGYMMSPDGAGVVPIPGGPNDPNTPKQPSAEIQRMNIATKALEDGLDRYSQMLDEFNPRNPLDQMDQGKRGAIDTLVADIRMQAKEAAALGALTGPDLEILDQMLADPGSFKGAWRGRGGLKSQIEEYRKSIGRRREAVNAETGRTSPNPVSATGSIAPSNGAVRRYNPETGTLE